MRAVFFFSLLATAPLAAQASITVLHGVPGLDDVDVYANQNKVLGPIDYTDHATLQVPAGKYDFEIRKGTQSLLELKGADLMDGKSYTAVAHLDATGKPKLSAFGDDISPLQRGDARLIVRHLAEAPAVDVVVRRFFFATKLFGDVSNGQEGVKDVNAGTYYVQLNPAGKRQAAFGPVRLSLEAGRIYRVHAIGKLGEKSFQLKVLPVDAPSQNGLTGLVRGKACGGSIGLSAKSIAFDEKFDVQLRGATANGVGLLHIGMSDSRLLFVRLPLSLDVLGLRGCSLYQSTEMIMPIRTDAQGAYDYGTKIPASMQKRFEELHFQYSFLAPAQAGTELKLTDYASVEKR